MKRSAPSTVGVVLAVATACMVASLWAPTDALNLKLSGINYDFRRGPDWDDQRCKGPAVVTREMRLLQTITNRVRIYSLTDCNVREVLRSATTLNMTVWLGVWVSNRTSVFKSELTTLKNLIKEDLVTNELIDGINVGSEVLYRNDTTPEVLIENFKAVKQVLTDNNLKIPLSITDTLGELYKHPEVVEVQDVVTFNQFPFWNKIPIKDAIADLEASVDAVGNMTKSKPFIITETGWPSAGFDKRASEANAASAAKYMSDFVQLATEKGWKYYYFAGFDTPYRKEDMGEDNSVEAWFGIFNASGKLNTHYDELTIEVSTMVDGPAIPINKTTKAPSTSSPTTSGGSLLSPKQWVLSVVSLALAAALW